MSSIKPFPGYYVNPERAEEVVSPPYDALTPQERYAYWRAHPCNFLNAMRSLEEFPPAERPDLGQLLDGNRAHLRKLIDDRRMLPLSRPALFIYRLSLDGHEQTGVVAEVPVSEYQRGAIKKHENTQEGKENDLVRYMEVVGASSSPICLTYSARAQIDAAVERLVAREPTIDFVAEDAVRQTVWTIDAPAEIEELTALFAAVPAAYLTDGHHRAAAAARIAMERHGDDAHAADQPHDYLLTAFFPDDQLRILEYNRRVSGLNGQSAEELLAKIAASFDVERLSVSDPEQARPAARGQVAMRLDDTWYRLTARDTPPPGDDPVASLDVTLLQERLFGPALGIGDPRSDPRLHYMSAAFDMADLERLCRGGEEIAFAVYPTSIIDLMAVADAGRTMPPKSTWFDPKLRSGLFLRLR